MNELASYNASRLRAAEALRDELVAAHRAKQPPRFADYPLPALRERLAAALSARWGQGRLEPQVELIERSQFGGDLALKFPQLLSDGAAPRGSSPNTCPGSSRSCAATPSAMRWWP